MVLHITVTTAHECGKTRPSHSRAKTLPPQTGRNSAATITAFVFYLFVLSFFFLLLTSCCAHSSRPASGPSCRVDSFNNTTMATSCHSKSKLKLRVREMARQEGKHGEMASLSQGSQQYPHHQSFAVVNTDHLGLCQGDGGTVVACLLSPEHLSRHLSPLMCCMISSREALRTLSCQPDPGSAQHLTLPGSLGL